MRRRRRRRTIGTRARPVGGKVVPVSLYEALSLIVSSVGTLGTVYIGLRQLRQNAPRVAATHPMPAPYGHAPAPVPYGQPPGPYGPGPYGRPGPQAPAPRPLPAGPRRPSSVTAASLVLFAAAAIHPFVVVLYYVIRLATAPGTAAEELSNEGIVDVLVFGGIAFLTALVGVFVARASRVALRCVWVLGALSVVTMCLLGLGFAGATLGPEAYRPSGFEWLFLSYFSFALLAYMVGASLLIPARSRAFFRRA
jgi:hypothetical protein